MIRADLNRLERGFLTYAFSEFQQRLDHANEQWRESLKLALDRQKLKPHESAVVRPIVSCGQITSIEWAEKDDQTCQDSETDLKKLALQS